MPETTNALRQRWERVLGKVNPIPDYADDPGGWEYRMRDMAHGIAKRRGWGNTTTRTIFVNDLLAQLATRDEMGDTAAFVRLFNRQLKLRGYWGNGKRERPVTTDPTPNTLGVKPGRRLEGQSQPAAQTPLPRPPVDTRYPFGAPPRMSEAEIEALAEKALADLRADQEKRAMTNNPFEGRTELDAAFPRENGKPIEDALIIPAPWVNDKALSAGFFADWDRLCTDYHFPKAERERIRKATLLDLCGKDSLKGYPGTPRQLLDALEVKLKAEGYSKAAPPTPQSETRQNGQGATPATPPATSIPDATQNAPEALKTGKNGDATPSPRLPGVTPAIAVSPETALSGMSEAGFSMNFFWCDQDGAETQFTMREATWQAGLANVEAFKAGLRKLGYMPKAEYRAKAGVETSVPQPVAPSPAETNRGIATCVFIRVVTSFTGGKPQLEFECNGFEKPLRFTSDKPGVLAEKLSAIRKLDGTPFTATDMATGNKFPGNWKVEWERREKDSKTYVNVVTVKPAA